MADSNITKQALAGALKELVTERPFEKISVSDICDRCRMNRKSFYYHFRDKYDLANWIFDTEFIELNQANAMQIASDGIAFDDRWSTILATCRYFYDNRVFYRRILMVEGQNSFSSHFRELIAPLLRLRIEELLGMENIPDMVYDFFVDGILCAMERWLLDKNCIPAEEFLQNLKKLLQVLYVSLDRRISQDPRWLE